MNFLFPLLAWLAALIGMMAGLWLLQRRTGNAGIVDVGWALGLGLSAIFYAFVCAGDSRRRILVGVMGGGWGLRLAGHLLLDRVLGHPEEGRYVKLRQDWGPAAQRNLFVFFQAQALVAALLSFPFLLAAQDSNTAGRWADLAAPALWLLALAGESLADRQLAAFKANPGNRGKTCRAGLWRYSRHPNYFFEWLLWCAFALLALPAPLGWTALLAPAFMLYLVLMVTGIPPTEAQAVRSRGEDYRRYQRETSAFVPWFPRRGAAEPTAP